MRSLTTTKHDLSAALTTQDVNDLTSDLAPTTTVYLPTPSDGADPAQQMEIRWANLARAAKDAGAPKPDLDAIERAHKATSSGSPTAHFSGSTWVAIASGGSVLAEGFSARPLTKGNASVAPVPALLPLLSYRSALVDHLIVTIDRLGADVTLITASDESTSTIEGDDEHIHRGKPGGWSQRRFQQRAENTWESNAKDVADHVTEVARSASPALIIVAGDERAIGFLREHLPQAINNMLTEVRGGRAEWSEKDIAERAAIEVDSWIAEQKASSLREFADACGTQRAVQGAAETLKVLRQGRAERLIVVDDTDEPNRRAAWTGDDPSLVFLDASESDSPLSEGPLADLAVRTAAHLGTEIFVAPSHADSAPSEGIGAILRG